MPREKRPDQIRLLKWLNTYRTYEAACAAIGWNPSTVSGYLNGDRPVSEKLIISYNNDAKIKLLSAELTALRASVQIKEDGVPAPIGWDDNVEIGASAILSAVIPTKKDSYNNKRR